MFRYFTLDDFDFNKKIVGVRVDINSPIIDNKIVMNERIAASAKTLKELSTKGAKVVVLAHQGRLGKPNCISLKEHCKLLEKLMKVKVNFVPELYSNKVRTKIANLKSSEILVLENLRFYEDEKVVDKPENIIKELEELFDFYVSDAFSVVHRAQTSMVDNSVVGLKKIPILAGRQMEKELKGLNGITETKKPAVYVMGGAKPDDLVDMLKENLPLKKVDFVILTGVIGEIALMIRGYPIGCKEKFLEEKNYLNSIKDLEKLMDKYPNSFILPKDLAIFDGKKRVEIPIDLLKSKKDLIDKYMVQDIGDKSVKFNAEFLKDAGSIYLKGPAGNFEEKPFVKGSKEMFKTLAKSKAFTYMGGGHSVTALERFASISDFNYVSLAGGALVRFISGKDLPGVKALERSFSMHDKHFEDFIVVGSNTLDIGVSVPATFSQVYLGDKIKVDEDFKTTIGGCGINVSTCISRLGGKVAYLGKISQENRDKIYEVLKKERVEIVKSKISKKPCAKSILLDTQDNDRVIFTYRGQNSSLQFNDFNYKTMNAKNFFFSALTGDAFRTELELAKKIKTESPYSNICIALNSNIIKTEKSLKTLLKNIDVVVLNLEEAEMLCKKKKISDCLKEMRKLVCEIVIITNGAHGAYAYDGCEEYYVKSEKVSKVVDTTGSGDSFSGTFFYFWSKGYGIKEAMQLGAKNSANVIRYKGAQYGLRYYDELIKE